MELAGNIYRLRAERGMSQEELAAALGVSRQSVSKWETGAATPELDKVAALAALFGVTMDELVLGEARTAQETDEEGDGEGSASYLQPRRRYIAAVALLCTGAALAAVLFLLGAGLIGPVVFTSPLWLCGLVCLKARRHVGFWCCVAAYLPVLWYIKWGTGVSYGDLFFWAPLITPCAVSSILCSWYAMSGSSYTAYAAFVMRSCARAGPGCAWRCALRCTWRRIFCGRRSTC